MAALKVKAASLTQRITHFFVDTWTYTAIWFAAGFVALKVAEQYGQGQLDDSSLYDWTIGTALATSYFGYYIISEYLFQKTLGKRITGTVVVDKSGNRPTLGKVILRTLLRLIPLEQFSFFILPFGLHDLWSGTMVIQEKEKTLHNKS